MRYSFLLTAGALVSSTSAAWISPEARNFIYVMPDGFGPASQTMARDYVSLLRNGENPDAPVSIQLPADEIVLGNVRTVSSDNLITDSAAAATAFACGVKTYNDAVGVDPEGKPVGSILEAAKLGGFKTGLVVTSTINHATPACYSAHVANRNSYEAIAANQIGYDHPLGPVVDILLGGGRCYFKPQSDETSCRSDDVDLFGFAKEQGYRVMQDREGFDELKNGTASEAALPYIGLFNDDQMMYEIDRSRQPEKEPSLLEMTQTALNSLDRATSNTTQGYFIMIEASRIDHAGHANDPAAHVHDIIMYNEVIKLVREWIDEHPDTMMLSAADHECGGLTLNGYNPLPLKDVTMSIEEVERLWEEYDGDDRRAYLADTILPGYGLGDLDDDEIDAILENDDLAVDLTGRLSDRAGVHWSTDGHSAVDVTLYGYGSGTMGGGLRSDMAGNWDNTQLPQYIESVIRVNLTETTEELRKDGTGWVGKRDVPGPNHIHKH